MKGILICGGTGSRLRPLTEITNKSLLPVYNKPLVCYPLETLTKAGINDIAVITGPEHMDQMNQFLGDGSRFGCTFTYKIQEKPGGIAQALSLAEEFANGSNVCAILGDNVFFDDLSPMITSFKTGAHLFLKEVPDPERFGVAEISKPETRNQPFEALTGPQAPSGKPETTVLSLEEKPAKPKSNLAVTGCYLYDRRCFDLIKKMKPSARGELEITDLSESYRKLRELTATILKDEWVDAGTFESLFKAAMLVRGQNR